MEKTRWSQSNFFRKCFASVVMSIIEVVILVGIVVLGIITFFVFMLERKTTGGF